MTIQIAGKKVDTAAGGGPGAHRYWRLNISAANDGSGVCIATSEWRETVGGADATGSGTASALFEHDLASNAFDADENSVWLHFGVNTSWIKYDFGSGNDKEILEYTIQCWGANASTAPKDFTLEYSDNDSDWTVADTVTGETGWTGLETRTFAV